MKRLGNQRNEVLALLKSLDTKLGWYRHPACKMWVGFEMGLIRYGLCICQEWISRGCKDTCYEKIAIYRDKFKDQDFYIQPPWLGNEAFHLSHKSNLIQKYPEHYRPLWPDVPDNLPYIWPSKNK